jgi:hypothetical protein
VAPIYVATVAQAIALLARVHGRFVFGQMFERSMNDWVRLTVAF